LLGTAALALLVGALGGFQRAGTRAEPWKPSTAVVTTGVYRITRNPMYLAMALLYAAASLVLDSGISLCLLAPLLVLVRKGVIEREERYLEHKFGEDYRAYKRTVRRWI
jgi:protein-S-isoprenylcysteine O-methyltransferase Ste14